MSTQKIEIQETIEFLNCIEVLAVFGAKILADGKVNHKDLSSARELMDKIHILLPAFNNISTIAEEIKDIDKAEISILLKKFIDIAKSISNVRSASAN